MIAKYFQPVEKRTIISRLLEIRNKFADKFVDFESPDPFSRKYVVDTP